MAKIKTRVLFIEGADDYSASELENDLGVKKIVKLVEKSGGKHEFDDGSIAKIIEFGPVDEEFVQFMFDEFIDYDLTKGKNFHVI